MIEMEREVLGQFPVWVESNVTWPVSARGII